MDYTAIFERAADGGIWGYIPEMPGATGMGDTIEEVEASLKAGLYLETGSSLCRAIPTPAIIATRTLSI